MPAQLDNPLYYLDNFQHALDWIGARYADLLNAAERQFLLDFAALSQPSRALLVRMIMRKGDAFRAGKLRYDEIGDTAAAMTPLVKLGWIDDAPRIDLSQLFDHLTKSEIVALFRAHIRVTSQPKRRLCEELLPLFSEQKTFAEWTGSEESLYALRVRDICDRVRLLYFGNLHQDWTEFVLAELGLFHYETVELSPDSRAFRERRDLDDYFFLHRCRERFDNQADDVAAILDDIESIASDNDWINARRSKLLFRIARHCERRGELPTAEALYERCGYAGARARRVRVMERLEHWRDAYSLAQQAFAAPESAAEWQHLQRALPRLAKKVGEPAIARIPPPLFERIELALPPPVDLFETGINIPLAESSVAASSVERCVQRYLHAPEAPVYYVENTLINSLFGLLCWDIIFAPLPGAFFHPFHSAPADLLHPEFYVRRADLFAERFAQLDNADYRATIWRHYASKYGRQSPFVFWGALDETLLGHALDCLPPAHLRHWFTRLLGDIKAHRAGMPDLIQFWPAQKRYRMVEVKGPGDRLQDNQLRWLQFCALHAMPVSVCYVQWQARA
jgi:hypothetical protein